MAKVIVDTDADNTVPQARSTTVISNGQSFNSANAVRSNVA